MMLPNYGTILTVYRIQKPDNKASKSIEKRACVRIAILNLIQIDLLPESTRKLLTLRLWIRRHCSYTFSPGYQKTFLGTSLSAVDILYTLLRFGRTFVAEISGQSRAEVRQKLTNSLLVLLIFGVLLSGDKLGEPCRSLKEDQVGDSADNRPIVVGLGSPARPHIEHDPEALLCCEVGMSTDGPKSDGIETTIKIFLMVI